MSEDEIDQNARLLESLEEVPSQIIDKEVFVPLGVLVELSNYLVLATQMLMEAEQICELELDHMVTHVGTVRRIISAFEVKHGIEVIPDDLSGLLGNEEDDGKSGIA